MSTFRSAPIRGLTVAAVACGLLAVPLSASASQFSGPAPVSVQDTADEFAISPGAYEERFRAVLAAKFGPTFSAAKYSALHCPEIAAGGDPEDAPTYTQDCEAIFGSGTERRWVSASFVIEDGAMTYKAFAGDQVSTTLRTVCPKSSFKARLAGKWRVTSIRAPAVAGCGGVSLMAGDQITKPTRSGTDFTVRSKLPRSFTNRTHGTGTGILPELNRWACKSRRRAGQRFDVTCRNASGFSYRYSMRRGS